MARADVNYQLVMLLFCLRSCTQGLMSHSVISTGCEMSRKMTQDRGRGRVWE